ncbi:aspartyl/asparaginyl beta-hydroxylase domain-containing protein [Sphingomonas sp. Y38-1Y]|uniref:aspartyl/asparaginyl beta-hydroxylase domain-containing protein n=1 Tax=Sphingomonas sp. Y38-1Y TaxID=3078265 RepID=UPI0028F071E0|nr:aspartyl/asparaginyl beta-hydroxylase domain-containing protein [Sphingomonas sp. Y38-1Y]
MVTDSLASALSLARGGDLVGAKAMLGRIVAEPGADADGWTMLAGIEARLGDAAGEKAALSAALALSPRHLPALLARAASARRAGDDRTAVRFYRTAFNAAAHTPPHASLHPALEEAQRFTADASRRFAETMEATLTDAGLTAGNVPPRVGEAIELLLGRRELHVQQPSMFYYPGLAQRAFFERAEFDWAPRVEAATAAIRDELMALLADGEPFAPYVASTPDQPAPANHLLDDPAWGAVHLFEGGQPHPVHADQCPATMAALTQAPQPAIGTRSPMALFSRLRPGTHIRPHHGVFNTRLICHLPLIVPPGCGIRVGADTREWREGELLIFDDSFEHEAWNRGTSDRVVLLFEVWRPDIGEDERAAITALLGAVEAHGIVADDA